MAHTNSAFPRPHTRSFNQSLNGGASQNVRYIGLTGEGGLKYGAAGSYGIPVVYGAAVSGALLRIVRAMF